MQKHSPAKTVGRFRHKSNFVQVRIECTYVQLYMYIQGSPVKILTPNTLEPEWPQHDWLAACVITQQ